MLTAAKVWVWRMLSVSWVGEMRLTSDPVSTRNLVSVCGTNSPIIASQKSYPIIAKRLFIPSRCPWKSLVMRNCNFRKCASFRYQNSTRCLQNNAVITLQYKALNCHCNVSIQGYVSTS